ncbi:MAG: tripartite tricarboxylate transporter permease [Syntrophomonadaceae bacterium]|jgi:putative tricarboxylic transport membrane protein
MLEMLAAGFLSVLTIKNMLFLIGGVCVGIVLGAIPGLSATMAIALVIPLTMTLDPTTSLIMLLGAYNGGIFGGSIAAILLATPGTSAAAATVADGFQMAKKGQGIKAIKTALVASVHGCIFSCIVLILVAGPVAKFALEFGPGEYSVLMLFALTMIGSLVGKNFGKGLLGGILGVLVSLVGIDSMTALPRLTFDIPTLTKGIDLIGMLIGLLAVSEIFVQIEKIAKGQVSAHLPPPQHPDDSRFLPSEYKRILPTIGRSSLIGCFIGCLPALGTTLAAFLGYDMAKRASKHPEKFGTGIVEGVAGPEAANNAVCGANLIPLLAFGVPGDVVAAILMGAFLVQGLTPGPFIFREAPHVVYGVYAGLIISNLCLFVIAWFSAKQFARVASLKTNIIYPIILAFCIVGTYAINQHIGDIWVMLCFAILGYVMIKFGFSPATMIIGFILGPIFERYMRQALLVSGGSVDIFFSSPICIVLWIITAFSVYTIIRNSRRDGKKSQQAEASEAS